MPIEINLPCKCPHCGEEFELFQSLAQDVLETVQTRLLAADTQAREEGRQTALAEARAAVQENVVQAQTQIETLQQQLTNEQATHAALQATLDQRMQNAMTQAQQQWQTQSNLEIQQRDNQIARLSHDLANLTSQLQQGHAQAQGEVGELAIENILRQTFPGDDIQEVSAGARGADWILHVRRAGQTVGKIIIEVKNARNWSNNWIPTLRQNQANANADLAVLVTTTLPNGMTEGGPKDNVWVCRFNEFRFLMHALRQSLHEVAQVRAFEANRGTNANRLYDFIQSTEFKHSIEALVTPVLRMKSELEKEKRALQRSWRQRETHLETAMENASNVIGRLAGHLPDGQLPSIEGIPALDSNVDTTIEA